MWKAITEFALQLHLQGLGHEAVIEIMIALLGLMLGVLTLIAGLFAAVIGVIAFFGYTTIRDEAVKRAGQTALETATKVAGESMKRMLLQVQASDMSESMRELQSEAYDEPSVVVAPTAGHKQMRRKAMTDKNLREGGDQ